MHNVQMLRASLSETSGSANDVSGTIAQLYLYV